MSRNPRILLACLVLPLLVAGCATARSLWPFGGRTAAAPQPVNELLVSHAGSGASQVAQFWERNTLVVDLSGVAGEGRMLLRRQPDHSWPMRIAFRVPPGRFAMLEVRGAQRVAWPVAAAGEGAVTVDLPAPVYDDGTPELNVSWGATH